MPDKSDINIPPHSGQQPEEEQGQTNTEATITIIPQEGEQMGEQTDVPETAVATTTMGEQPTTPVAANAEVSPEELQASMELLGVTPEQMKAAQNSTIPPASQAAERQQREPRQDAPQPGFSDYLKDDIKGVWNGVAKGVNSWLKFSWSTSDLAKQAVNKVLGEGTSDIASRTPPNIYGLPELETKYMPAEVLAAVGQFFVGFKGIDKILRNWKYFQGAGNIGEVLRIEAASAGSDFISFEGMEERLGNLFEQVPWLKDSFLTLTATKPGDTEMQGRFKNMLEGMGLGMLLNGLVWMARVYQARRARQRTGNELINELIHRPDEEWDELAKIPLEEEQVENAAKQAPPADASATPATQPGAATVPPADASATPAAQPGATAVPPEAPKLPSLSFDAAMDFVKTALGDPDKVPNEVLFSHNFLRDVYKNPDDARTLYRMSEKLGDHTKKAAGPQNQEREFKNAVQDLKDTGLKFDELLEQIPPGQNALETLGQHSIIVRNALHFTSIHARLYANKILGGNATPIDREVFTNILDMMMHLKMKHANFRTEAGRLLSLQKLKVTDATSNRMFKDHPITKWLKPKTEEEQALLALKEKGVTSDMIEEQARLVLSAEGNWKRTVNTVTTVSKWKYAGDVASEVFVANILSGPATHAINIGGNLINAFDGPLSRIIGGKLSSLAKSPTGKAELQFGIDQAAGMKKGLFDSWRVFGKALRFNTGILEQNLKDSGSKIEVRTNNMSYEKLKRVISPDGSPLSAPVEVLARAYGYAGTMINLPLRIMGGVDELFKQIIYRGHLYAQLRAEGRSISIPDNQLEAWVMKEMENHISPLGAVSKTPQAKRALREAQIGTFQESLGNTGKAFQHLTSQNPLFKFVIPFVKGPANILKNFIQHVPVVSFAFKNLSLEEQLGKTSLGMITAGLAYYLAAEGRLTGAPPIDRQAAEHWRRAGNQEYSIRIGDTWVSYRRADPVGLFFGVTADLVSVFHFLRQEHPEYMEQVEEKYFEKLIAAGVNNLTSKAYFTGVTDVAKVIETPENRGGAFVGKLLGNFIPFSSALRDYEKMINDPVYREIRDWTDYIKNTSTLVGRQSLPYQRDWVTGNVREFTYFPTHKKDTVLDELARIGADIPGEPGKKISGVELTPEQHMDLNRYHGQLKISGKTMYQRLDELFSSPDYKRLNYIPGFDNPGVDIVREIIDDYRKDAQNHVLRKYPELNRKVTLARGRAMASKAGQLNESTDAKLQNLINNHFNNSNNNAPSSSPPSPSLPQ
jgi:hypothetical protein